MLDQCDKRLCGWVRSVAGGDVEVTLGPPRVSAGGRGVSLYLVQVVPKRASRGAKRPPLQLQLRYVVTTWAPEAEQAHRLLGELAFSALEQSDFEVEAEATPPAVWAALQVPPLPSLVLSVPVQRDRPEAVAPPVRQARTEAGPMRSWQGYVLGPEDVPIAGARVDLVDVGRTVRTDVQGRFAFRGAPGSGPPARFRVTAKGRQLDVAARPDLAADSPLIVRLDLDTPAVER